MKSERITIRVSEDEKKEINVLADKLNMNTSEYIYNAIKDKMDSGRLSESDEKLNNIFNTSFKQIYEPYQRHLLLVLNRLDFNTRLLIKQQDIFMQHLKVPQTKEELIFSVNNHPITDKAEELVLKDVRAMSSKKKDLIDE